MNKIICIGSACKDVFFPTSEGRIVETPDEILSQKKIEFELGAKYKIEDRYEALGGCAVNVAVGLARLGTQVSCYSHIGNDHIADWILVELKKNNVGPEHYNRFTVQKLMIAPPATINENLPMEKVMEIFEDCGAWNLPVVDNQKRYVGFVSKSKIFNSYRHVLVHFSDE